MKVTVVLALAQGQWVREVDVAVTATVADAIRASGVQGEFPGIDVAALGTGIWNKPCPPDAPLRENDRVELYRPILADAKAMRRARLGATPSRRARSGR